LTEVSLYYARLSKRNFRIDETDAEHAIARKVERSVLRLGEDLRPILPYLKNLLAVDPGDPTVLAMDPRLRRAEIFDALRRVLVRAAEIRPQVLVLEDLHWVDQVTEESLRFTADSVPGSRILQILTYRPGYHQPFGDRTYYTRIVLDAMAASESLRMIKAIMAADSLPGALETLIVRKAEGNPFFVEEVVKSVQELGALRREGGRHVLARRLEEIVIPDTIQDVIMARIDRLAEAHKKALQFAAVIGREFTQRLLARIADLGERTEECLRELKALELVYEKALFPEVAYMFKHALTHEVAYNSLLVQRRKELHRLIGLAIEELYADRLVEQYEVLAHHFFLAEDWPRALDYLVKAADKAARAFATRDALALYNEALDVTEQLGTAANATIGMAIHRAKADLYFVLSEFERFRTENERLLALAHQAGDRMTEAGALAGAGWASIFAHDFDVGLDYSDQAIQVAKQSGATTTLAAAHFTSGLVYAARGQLDEADEQLGVTRALSESAGDVIRLSQAIGLAGFLKNFQGDYAEASRLLSESLRSAQEHKLLVPLLDAFFMYGVTLTGKGDYDAALAVLQEGLALSERVGDELWRHRMLNSLGWLYLELGDLERGADLNRRATEGAQKRGDHEQIANAEINLGDAFMAKGDLAPAQEFLDRVHRLVKDPATSEWGRWRYSTHLFASLGDLWLARGDTAKAREFADQCLEIATRTKARKNLVKGWRLRGEIAMAGRQWDEAEEALLQALAVAQMIGNPPQLWKTHAALGRLSTERNKPDAAHQAYQAARLVIEGIKGRLRSPDLLRSLEAAPLIQQVCALAQPPQFGQPAGEISGGTDV